MRFGLAMINFRWPGSPRSIGPTLARVLRDADQAGVHAIWYPDHFLQLPMYGSPRDPVLEPYAALAFTAAHTERARFGTLVTCVTHRAPALLVKSVTTLDVLSGGRAYFGIGVGASEREHLAMGLPRPAPTRDRFELLEETLRLAHHMWSGSEEPFHGRQLSAEWPLLAPVSLQRPRPPVLVGGGGERRTLPLVARYGDACNLFANMGPDGLRQKFDVLRRCCDDVERPYEDIERTTYSELALSERGGEGTVSPEVAARSLAALAEAGVDQAIVGVMNLAEPGVTDALADLVARVAEFVPAGRTG